MKALLQHSIHIACFGMAFLFFAGNSAAQIRPGSFELHEGYNERYVVLTDRNLFVAGENIHFAVINITGRDVEKAINSRVFYMELLKGDGTQVTGVKYPMTSEGTEGTFRIPDNAVTGHYFLRSYTRWMRNFSTSDFSYNQIRVINPYMQGLENPVEENPGNPNGIEADDSIAAIQMPVRCTTDKMIYGNREKVLVTLEVPAFIKAAYERYCVSVTRPGAADANNAGIVRLRDPYPDGPYPLQFIPETDGIYVSGKILYKDKEEAVKNALVQLSMLNEDGDYLSYYTRDDGKFVFSLYPFSGRQDFFISARAMKEDLLDIRIDRDFANHNEPLYTGAFKLNRDEKALAVEMMINSQVNQSYWSVSDSGEIQDREDSTGHSFYGQPMRTVYIDEFIDLPTLEEVFFELVPEVNIIKRKGVPQMIMTGNARNNADLASYNPLVLVDRVPVSNLVDLLEVSPQKIQRIELINNLYVKGDIIFGGIVSIFSKKGDLGGVNLPANSSFYIFSGYDPKSDDKHEAYPESQHDPRIPDLRNCLYWDPSVYINPGKNIRLEFYTSDSRGDYEIVVRALNMQGEVMEKRFRFTVR